MCQTRGPIECSAPDSGWTFFDCGCSQYRPVFSSNTACGLRSGWDGYRLGLGFIYGENWPKGGDLPIEIHACSSSSHPEGDLRPV